MTLPTETTRTPTRRRFIAALLSLVPAFTLFRHVRPTEHDDIVEVDGWVLKRSDLL